MYMLSEHYHCNLCGNTFATQAEANKCFWEHTEEEILRWVAYELVCARHFAPASHDGAYLRDVALSHSFIDELNRRFKVADIDEYGAVWSLAIRGKRL